MVAVNGLVATERSVVGRVREVLSDIREALGSEGGDSLARARLARVRTAGTARGDIKELEDRLARLKEICPQLSHVALGPDAAAVRDFFTEDSRGSDAASFRGA